MGTQFTRTTQDIKAEWCKRGISMRKWAMDHGFHPATVHEVISGKNAGTIGVGHRIAVMLGIKEGEIDGVQ